MILFEEDIDRYPKAIVDTYDPNESFVEYSLLLKEMGVKNHLFPIILLNPELKGLDPFDPNLTNDEMLLFMTEFRLNPFAFFRKAARVPGGTTENPIYFKANRGNIALYWLFFNHITPILIQIRQTGKSLSSDLLSTYLLNIGTTRTQINLLTKDETLRSANLSRLKEIDLELPYWLRRRTKFDIGNTEEMTVKALKNSYKGHLPNRSPKLANAVGRGLTSPIFLIDEAAFFANIRISMPAALAAGTAARTLASNLGKPYGTVITTTAGMKDDPDGMYVYNLLMESAEWTEKFFDCKNLEELELVVRKSSLHSESEKRGKLQVNCTFNHRQLGYTDEWLEKAIEESHAVGDAADRDFRNKWTSGTQQSPFTPAQADLIRSSQADVVNAEITRPYGYIIRWYFEQDEVERRMNSEPYVLSLDTSDAIGNDDIGMTVRSVKDGSIVGAGNFNETNLITFAEFLCNLLIRFPKITLIIERRSSGMAILDYLLVMLPAKGINPFTRIYNTIVQNADADPDKFKEVTQPVGRIRAETYVRYKKSFGFATSAYGETSRTDLYGITLQNCTNMTGDKVHDKKIIDQLLGLTIRNGRIDHQNGGHDDMCISWLLGFWLLTKGRNLHAYGIEARNILCENQKQIEKNNPRNLYDDYLQNKLRDEIEDLVNELQRERDPYACSYLENRLRMLSENLNDADKATLSVDELINNIAQERIRNANYNRYR